MARYVALLRGINLGGRRLKMDELRAAFAALGFAEAQTLLASGNVIFTADTDNDAQLKGQIESGLEAEFGFPVPTILRSQSQIETLVEADPATGIPAHKDTKLHVSFLNAPLPAEIKLPHISADPDFEVHRIDELHLFDIVRLGPSTGSVDLMDWLATNFGVGATTRTWNTVLKIQTKLAAP